MQRIIDIHTHGYPLAIARRTMQQLGQVIGAEHVPYGNGTVDEILNRQRERGITLSVVLNMALKPRSVSRINDFAIEINQQPGLLAFGAMHPDMTAQQMTKELNRLQQSGIMGIKLHPCYQQFSIDEPRAYSLYEKLIDHKMIVLFHAGLDPMDMAHNYASPQASLQVHRDLPELTMILAHLGGAYQPEEAAKILWGQDIYLDTGLCGNDADGVFVQKLFDTHPNDKILYGSDYPWHDKEELWMLDYPGLTSAQKQMALYDNAAKLLGIQEA